MGTDSDTKLSGPQKAALVLSTLKPELAAALLKSLPEEDVELLTIAVTELAEIPEGVRRQALLEFTTHLRREQSGPQMFSKVLEKGVGKEKAETMLARVRMSRNEDGTFEYLMHMDPEQVVAALRTERPQTLAMIFSQLDPKRSAEFLSRFEPELQAQIIVRIGHMERLSPESIATVNAVLRKKLMAATSRLQASGGAKVIAQVLNNVDQATEKRMVEALQNSDANLLNDVKKLMLVFDDLVVLSDTAAQALLREVEMNDIILALKGAKPELKALLMRNLSSRAAERLKEEMELLGPRPRSEVHAAQERIIAVVRRLEEEGKVKLNRGGSTDDLLT